MDRNDKINVWQCCAGIGFFIFFFSLIAGCITLDSNRLVGYILIGISLISIPITLFIAWLIVKLNKLDHNLAQPVALPVWQRQPIIRVPVREEFII